MLSLVWVLVLLLKLVVADEDDVLTVGDDVKLFLGPGGDVFFSLPLDEEGSFWSFSGRDDRDLVLVKTPVVIPGIMS